MRPFDCAQDRPFDCAQDRPFDCAQDRPFDCAQDRPFDCAQDRPFHTFREHRGRWLLILGLLVCSDVARASSPCDLYIITTTTVVDRRTGLTWQRNPPATTVSWAAASAACATLGAGWQLPTVREIETLVDVTSGWPAIDTTAFPGTQIGAGYWTSSCYEGAGACSSGTPASVWILDFTLGQPKGVATATTQTTTSEYYRCVNSG